MRIERPPSRNNNNNNNKKPRKEWRSAVALDTKTGSVPGLWIFYPRWHFFFFLHLTISNFDIGLSDAKHSTF